MRVVLSHPNALLAQAARDHLLAHGILAAVVGRTEGWMAAVRSHDVMLCFSKQYEEARGLLADPSWQEAAGGEDAPDEVPDLSLLDRALAPGCPACGAALPLEAAIEACPACAAEVDVAELIAQEHGPEALADCYAEPPPLLGEGPADRFSLLCSRCEYSLDGLPKAGTCPECGFAYDKEALVREFLGR